MRTFDVVDATSDANADLMASAPLLNSAGELKKAGLEKTGAGTMQLNAANTYSGPTTVNEGTLGDRHRKIPA